MRVIVPYANDVSDPAAHAMMKRSLALDSITAEFIRMREPYDYASLIRALWKRRERFVLVEHDVVVCRGAVRAVWSCLQPLCGYDGTLCCAAITPVGECGIDLFTSWMHVDKALLDSYHRQGIPYHDHCRELAWPMLPIANLNRANIPNPEARV